MDLKITCLLCCILMATVAAVPPYNCKGRTNCSKAYGFNRDQIIACLYFCDLDDDKDNILPIEEWEGNFFLCANAFGGVCPEPAFIFAMKLILPICDDEADNMFKYFASRDGVNDTVSFDDNRYFWDRCMFHQTTVGTEEPCVQEGYNPTWDEMWLEQRNPDCARPLP